LNTLLLGGSGQDAFYLTSSLAKKKVGVTWVYRGNALCKFKQYFEEKDVSFVQVESYHFDCLVKCFEIDQFDSIVLIAGVVGNQKGRNDPLNTYSQNMQMLNTACSLIASASRGLHLYYFSSSDVDGTSSITHPSIFSPKISSPKTVYGLSKLHASEYLKSLKSQGLLSSTIIYLGMHESFNRTGDYVLSKIKQIVSDKRAGKDLAPMSFGNLNIYLDIGFAQEYMNIVGQLIVSGFYDQEVVIGTGEYSNLHGLCIDILNQFDIDSGRYIVIDSDQQEITFYPLVPFSLAGLPLDPRIVTTSQPINSPASLTGEMLKYEYDYLTRHE